MPETSRDLMDRNAGLQTMGGGPLGPERVRVRETVRDPSGQTVAADQSVDGLSRQRDRALLRVTAQRHEQQVLITQPTPRASGWSLTHAWST
jgi:hypothetical protein